METSAFKIYSENKQGPKGQHIVHLRTMCHPCWWVGKGGYLIGLKNTIYRVDWILASCTISLSSSQRFHKWRRKWISQSDAKVVILVLWSPKHKLGRGYDHASYRVSLSSVQPLHRRRRKSLSQEPWPTSSFSDQLKNHELGRGRSVLATCQVSLNSVQRF